MPSTITLKKERSPAAEHSVGSPRIAARLVRSPPPPAAVARRSRRDVGSLPRLAVGDHAAADHGEGGRALFRKVRRALAGCHGAGSGLAGRGAADVGRARLLLAGTQSPCLRGGGAARAWRGVSRHGGGPARAAGDRALHGSRDRRDRVRSPHHAGRRQYRAGGVAAVRGRRGTAAGQAADPGTGGDAARATTSRRRQRAGADGSGRLDLHAEEAGLLALSARRGLHGARARDAGELSAQGAEEERELAARRRLRRHAR